jgi:hypothetical protein
MRPFTHLRARAAIAALLLGLALTLALGASAGASTMTAPTPMAGTTVSASLGSNATPTTGASASAIFGCRASVARVMLGSTVLAEPAVANAPTNPCEDDQTLVQQTGLAGGTSALNLGTIGPAGAYTHEVGELGGTTSPAATAVAQVNALSLNLGPYTLSVAGNLEAQVAVECTKTSLTSQASSNLDVITLTGPGLPAGGETLEIGHSVNQIVGNLPAALQSLVSITANEQIASANAITERMLDIKLLNSAVQVVIGEATVAVPNPGICGENTIAPPTGTIPSTLMPCTSESVLDSSTGDCVLFVNGQVIYVSVPFGGPQGGTVVPLIYARQHYRSPCLYGPGPKWAFIVTKPGIHARGTFGSDRIIGLGPNETIAGLAGNDCIDEQGGGHEHLFDGNGNDRAYSLKGTTRIGLGGGNDYVNGQHSGGFTTVGNGRDTVIAGTRPSSIDVGLHTDRIHTTRAYARIYDLSYGGIINCGNRNDRLFARIHVARYAAKHGCRRIVHLH